MEGLDELVARIDVDPLGDGVFTAKDRKIQGISKEVGNYAKNKSISLLESISHYISTMKNHEYLIKQIPTIRKSKKYYGFRKRTASEILNSGYRIGCTEKAIVFLALARQLGIPSLYIETIQKEELSKSNINMWQFHGHIFVCIQSSNHWMTYEPLYGFTPNSQFTKDGKEYIPIAVGLDFSQLYLITNNGLASKPITLQTTGQIHLAVINYIQHYKK